jgi:cation:H+ antiporter
MSLATIAFLIVGLVALVAGAEALVRGAARLAARTGMSSVVIGLTVVAFGTSAPELAVSVGDALRGGDEAGSIAIGNVVGSNIANILLVLGMAAAVGGSLFVAQRIVRLDVPIMIGASVLVFVFVLNERLGRLEGLILLLALAVYLVWTVIGATRGSTPEIVTEYDDALDPESMAKASVASDIGFLILGLAMLVFGSQALVSSASNIATDLGVSDLVIGLTVVAIGT